MTLVSCPDDTCKHNVDGFCRCAVVEMEITSDYNNRTIVACKNYEDKRSDE